METESRKLKKFLLTVPNSLLDQTMSTNKWYEFKPFQINMKTPDHLIKKR